jgi:hypothetical protein
VKPKKLRRPSNERRREALQACLRGQIKPVEHLKAMKNECECCVDQPEMLMEKTK